jgi:hypothetical protein
MKKFKNFYSRSNSDFIVASIFVFILTYAFTIILAPYHFGGDQEHYVNAYNSIRGLALLDAYEVYPTIIHTVEPIHFFIIWIFSSIGIEKNHVMAVANSLLAILFYIVLRKKGNTIPIAIILLFSSYYIMTMFFTLERTKFAFIFFFLYLLNRKIVFLILSIFSHTLILIPIGCHFISRYLTKQQLVKDFKSSIPVYCVKIIGVVTLIFLIYEYFGTHLGDKFSAYYNEKQSQDAIDGWQISIMLIMTLLTTKDKIKPGIYFILLIILASLIGGARVNMLSYFGFLFYSNSNTSLYKFFSVILAMYFSFKCIIYGSVIINLGG